jgi:hypothetical protein
MRDEGIIDFIVTIAPNFSARAQFLFDRHRVAVMDGMKLPHQGSTPGGMRMFVHIRRGTVHARVRAEQSQGVRRGRL